MSKVTVLNEGDKAFKAMLGVRTRDYPCSKLLTTNEYLILKECEAVYMANNHLTPELFTLLGLFVRMFRDSGKALNAYVISKLLFGGDLLGSQVMNTRHKLNRLVSKGYAEVIGKSGRNVLFIPTERAYKELSELIKKTPD